MAPTSRTQGWVQRFPLSTAQSTTKPYPSGRTTGVAAESSRISEWLFGRTIKAIIQARIATGEVKGDLKTLLRHPGAIPHLRRARRQASLELPAISDDARAADIVLIAHLCDVELAKLHLSQGRPDEARPLLQEALAFSDRSSENEGASRIRKLLLAATTSG